MSLCPMRAGGISRCRRVWAAQRRRATFLSRCNRLGQSSTGGAMRRTRLAWAFVSVLGVASVCGQSDPLAAIRQALTAKYTLTTATADKTAIVAAGSLIALKKSDLLAAAVTGAIVVSNSYRYGKITRGFMGQIVRGSSETRAFVAGEKLWVTDIEVKPNGIVFSLLS